MACRKYQKWLPLFIDNALSERRQQQMASHLLVCAECMRELETLRKILRLVGGLQHVNAPADFSLRCNQRFECEMVPKPRPGLWLPLAWGSAGAALVLAGLLVVPSSYWKPLPRDKNNLLAESRPAAEPVSPAALPEAPDGKFQVADLSFPLEIQPVSRFFRRPSSAYRSLPDLLPPSGLARSIAYHPGLAVPPPSDDSADDTESVQRQQREWHGDHCAIREAMSLTANSEQELQAVYARAGIAPQLDVDWDKFMVAAIFAGRQTGCGVEIKAAVERRQDGGLLLRYHLEKPEPAGGPDESCQPCLLMLLPRTSLPVQVMEN